MSSRSTSVQKNAPIPVGLPSPPPEPKRSFDSELAMLIAKLKAHQRSSAEAKRTMAAKQPRIVPPAVSQKRGKPIPKGVRIVLSLHPKRAAIVRFDARIGKASPLLVDAAASASASSKESSPTQATDVRDICSAPTGKCFFTLLRPSGEASPLDPITRHLVRLWAFT